MHQQTSRLLGIFLRGQALVRTAVPVSTNRPHRSALTHAVSCRLLEQRPLPTSIGQREEQQREQSSHDQPWQKLISVIGKSSAIVALALALVRLSSSYFKSTVQATLFNVSTAGSYSALSGLAIHCRTTRRRSPCQLKAWTELPEKWQLSSGRRSAVQLLPWQLVQEGVQAAARLALHAAALVHLHAATAAMAHPPHLASGSENISLLPSRQVHAS